MTTKPPSKSRPVAPPVYRPEGKKIVQAKTISSQRTSPAPPPVYRPQPVPRVLQTKRALPLAGHATRDTVQPKSISKQSWTTTNQTSARVANSLRPITVPRTASPFSAVQLATKSRKQCDAKVIVKNDSEYPGAYKNGIHAEIQALENYFDSGGTVANIKKIELSSKPCKYCHLILSDLGIRGKVEVEDDDREFGSCQGGSYGWFYQEGSVWKALKKAGYKDQEAYITSVIERQREL